MLSLTRMPVQWQTCFLVAFCSFFLFSFHFFLLLHPAPIVSNKMLRDVDRRSYRIVSWCIAIPAYGVFEVIAFPYIKPYAITSVFLQCNSNILLFQLRVPCIFFFVFQSLSRRFLFCCSPLTSSSPPGLRQPGQQIHFCEFHLRQSSLSLAKVRLPEMVPS